MDSIVDELVVLWVDSIMVGRGEQVLHVLQHAHYCCQKIKKKLSCVNTNV